MKKIGFSKFGSKKNLEEGATLVEYVLIIGLISLVIVVALATPLGTGITNFANDIKGQLNSAGDQPKS